jgi:hypothetical protein
MISYFHVKSPKTDVVYGRKTKPSDPRDETKTLPPKRLIPSPSYSKMPTGWAQPNDGPVNNAWMGRGNDDF